MNYKMMGRLTAQILFIEGLFMLPALCISLYLGEDAAVRGFLITMAIAMTLGIILYLLCRSAQSAFYAADGMVCVAFSWFVLSLIGALPFYISEAIPKFIDAFFETVSGFTTTGAYILPHVEYIAQGNL